MEHITMLINIILINLVLSGDNAVLIALASRGLPDKQRKLAMFWGTCGAIFLLVILTIGAALLLKVPLLQMVGGVLVILIAIKLFQDEGKESECPSKIARNLLEAVKIILIANLLMSTDNVLAMAGISKGNIPLLIIGLSTSIPVIMLGAQIIVFLMKRFLWIIYVAAGILCWVGGKMIIGDKLVATYLHKNVSTWDIAVLNWMPLILALLIVIYGYWFNMRQRIRSVRAYHQGKNPS